MGGLGKEKAVEREGLEAVGNVRSAVQKALHGYRNVGFFLLLFP